MLQGPGLAPWAEWRLAAGLFWGVAWTVLEEEGRRWLSRTDTLDSRLWGRPEEEEEDGPGLWSERREEDRPSPSRGDTTQKKKKKEQGEEEKKGKRRNKGWSKEEKT